MLEGEGPHSQCTRCPLLDVQPSYLSTRRRRRQGTILDHRFEDQGRHTGQVCGYSQTCVRSPSPQRNFQQYVQENVQQMGWSAETVESRPARTARTKYAKMACKYIVVSLVVAQRGL